MPRKTSEQSSLLVVGCLLAIKMIRTSGKFSRTDFINSKMSVPPFSPLAVQQDISARLL